MLDPQGMSSFVPILMRSLSPERECCLSLEEMGLLLREVGADPELCVIVVAMLGLLREDVRRHFPENIFYDDEALALALVQSQDIEGLFGKVRVLLALFGAQSPIKFRYVHDWLYGYDWVKWVSRNPEFADSKPFSEAFVDYMMKRGEEILASISAKDDETYKPLNDDSARNIFGFSRVPADELLLFESLSKEGSIPLVAWDINATLCADRDYFELRQQRAKALGLTFPSGGKPGDIEFPSEGKADEHISIEGQDWKPGVSIRGKTEEPDGVM